MTKHLTCCCGNADLSYFSQDYARCPMCETLIALHMPEGNPAEVIDDERDFYGREYWFSHQQVDLGFDNIIVRARTDLPERCLHWLRTLLKYKLPPARVLEIGSAHGGFVAMLRWTGFDAVGLEVSPWVVEFSRKTFDIPVLLGPVEDQHIDLASLDVIALMDVLEHLPDPVGTLGRCLELLKPDGILLIQTPRYSENKAYDDMVAQNDPFLLQLMSKKEHLYLFSQNSIRTLLTSLACEWVQFEPAIFAHYDMFLVAGRSPLTNHLSERIEDALSAVPSARFVLAMLDLERQLQEIRCVVAERGALQAKLLNLRQQFEAGQADRAARLEVIHQQGEEISRLESEVHRWLKETKRLEKRANILKGERNFLKPQVDELQQQLEAAESDRAARLEVILQQGKDISRLESEVHRWLEESKMLWERVSGLEEERNALRMELEELRRQSTEVQVDPEQGLETPDH